MTTPNPTTEEIVKRIATFGQRYPYGPVDTSKSVEALKELEAIISDSEKCMTAIEEAAKAYQHSPQPISQDEKTLSVVIFRAINRFVNTPNRITIHRKDFVKVSDLAAKDILEYKTLLSSPAPLDVDQWIKTSGNDGRYPDKAGVIKVKTFDGKESEYNYTATSTSKICLKDQFEYWQPLTPAPLYDVEEAAKIKMNEFLNAACNYTSKYFCELVGYDEDIEESVYKAMEAYANWALSRTAAGAVDEMNGDINKRIEDWYANGTNHPAFWQDAPYQTHGDIVELIKDGIKRFGQAASSPAGSAGPTDLNFNLEKEVTQYLVDSAPNFIRNNEMQRNNNLITVWELAASFGYKYCLSTMPVIKWKNCGADRPPMEKVVILKQDNINQYLKGNFFKENDTIRLYINGTETYAGYYVEQKNFNLYSWLDTSGAEQGGEAVDNNISQQDNQC